jgi:hypothetical protein
MKGCAGLMGELLNHQEALLCETPEGGELGPEVGSSATDLMSKGDVIK